jgi:hypothetical protein
MPVPGMHRGVHALLRASWSGARNHAGTKRHIENWNEERRRQRPLQGDPMSPLEEVTSQTQNVSRIATSAADSEPYRQRLSPNRPKRCR